MHSGDIPVNAPARKALSKKTRFEVFKRDKFTCQYCGAKAPDAVLECDHIKPVAEGGTDDILNLVTACQGCNRGKGARRLDDRSAVERQRVQIEELEARREQIEMMLRWRDQAEKEMVDSVQEVADRILAKTDVYQPNEGAKAKIRRSLKTYPMDELLAAMDISFDTYMEWDGDKPNLTAWNKAFDKIPGVARVRREQVSRPYIRDLLYIQGILRKRFDDPHGKYFDALEEFHLDGASIEDLTYTAKASDDWAGFCNTANCFARDAEHDEVIRRLRHIQDILRRTLVTPDGRFFDDLKRVHFDHGLDLDSMQEMAEHAEGDEWFSLLDDFKAQAAFYNRMAAE